ncbi:MAG TPA: DUF6394 family protein [Nakamurella sp.]
MADLQLIAAALAWGYAAHICTGGVDARARSSVVSLSGGALLANLVLRRAAGGRDRFVPPPLRPPGESPMSNVLLVFWKELFEQDDDERPHRHRHRRRRRRSRIGFGDQASTTIFVIMRRMRAPLITLIVIFAVTVLGLVLIPGKDPAGQPFPHDVLRRVLLHELHRVDDRFRRTAVPVHRQPADVGSSSSISPRTASTRSTWSPTTPTSPVWPAMCAIRTTWPSPGWTNRTAPACWP